MVLGMLLVVEDWSFVFIVLLFIEDNLCFIVLKMCIGMGGIFVILLLNIKGLNLFFW